MGWNRYKKTYSCDCGEDYGSCEKRSFFILYLNRTSDVWHLYHKLHADEPDSKLEEILVTSDKGIEALRELLNAPESPEELAEGDDEEVKEARGW